MVTQKTSVGVREERAVINVSIMCDTAACITYVNRRFGVAYRFHFQVVLSAEQVDPLTFDPEDVGDAFHRNVGSHTY
jgi:hypothetical protein